MPPPSAYFVALEFPGTSPNFRYSSPLWTNTALHNSAVSGGTERKTSDFFTAQSMQSSGLTEGAFRATVMAARAGELRAACSVLPAATLEALGEIRRRVAQDSLPLLSLLQAEPLRMQSSHLSFQEYFAACALCEEGTKLSGVPPWQWPAWWANAVAIGGEMGEVFGKGLLRAAGVEGDTLDYANFMDAITGSISQRKPVPGRNEICAERYRREVKKREELKDAALPRLADAMTSPRTDNARDAASMTSLTAMPLTQQLGWPEAGNGSKRVAPSALPPLHDAAYPPPSSPQARYAPVVTPRSYDRNVKRGL